MCQQQKLDADPNGIEQINFTKNVDRVGNNFLYWKSERNEYYDFNLLRYNTNIKADSMWQSKCKIV